jgi:hypothetical protein
VRTKDDFVDRVWNTLTLTFDILSETRATLVPCARFISAMLEVVARGVGIDQQGIGDIGRRAPLAEQDHGIDATGLANVPHSAMGSAEFGKLLRASR